MQHPEKLSDGLMRHRMRKREEHRRKEEERRRVYRRSLSNA